MRRVALVLVLAGCRQLLGIDDPQLGDGPPGGGDGGPCVSFASLLDTCALPPAADLALGGDFVFDTATGVLAEENLGIEVPVVTVTATTPSGDVQVIVGASVAFGDGARLRAVGSRPLAIVASGAITLATGAVIDVGDGGAGARAECQPGGAARGISRDGGAGGGGGGGFHGTGGDGGQGNVDGTPAGGGIGGAGAAAFPGTLVGGCPGADGGDDNNDAGGSGGLGGGAVYLVAANRIEIDPPAAIAAGGGGGKGGEQHAMLFGDAGGGGGGSGGMIVLEAPFVRMDGTLAANGGGGGEGSGGTAPGNAGAAGMIAEVAAAGGRGGSTASDGGDGGARTQLDGTRVTELSTSGGGGGGGGAGFLHIIAAELDTGGILSPAPN